MSTPHTRPTTNHRSSGWGPRLLTIGLPLLAVAVLTTVNYPAMRAVVMGTVGSTRALLIVAGVIALTVGWSAILRKVVSNPWTQSALVLVPVAAISGLYIAPYFGGDTVVEDQFPVAVAGPVADEPPPEEGADEPDPALVQATTPQPAEAQSATPPPAPEPAPTAAPAEPAGPVELGRGTFTGLDGHYANGQAALYDLGAGTRIVRLEDVDLQPVPEPVVYLVPVADAEVVHPGSINLGPLRGNVGNQNYDIPADVDLTTGDWSVLVWCEVFASPVGTAPQT